MRLVYQPKSDNFIEHKILRVGPYLGSKGNNAMKTDLKNRIIELIESNAVAATEGDSVPKALPFIKSGDVQASTSAGMSPSHVIKIYDARRQSLEGSGRHYFGLDELIAVLSDQEEPVKIVQITGVVGNVTIFLDNELTLVLGVIFLEL